MKETSSKRTNELLAMAACPSEHPCPFFSMSRDKGNEVHEVKTLDSTRFAIPTWQARKGGKKGRLRNACPQLKSSRMGPFATR